MTIDSLENPCFSMNRARTVTLSAVSRKVAVECLRVCRY